MSPPPFSKVFAVAVIVIVEILAIVPPVHAQGVNDIQTNGRTGSEGIVEFTENSNVIDADLYGTAARSNLFFGFDRFNVGSGASVTFDRGSLSGNVDHVIAYVDGVDSSDILGDLRVSGIGEDHFFLLNPNGVLFGPTATVSTSSSFHVSTANELVFENGDTLSATDPTTSILSSALPEAFGFLGGDSGEISVQATLELGNTRVVTLVGGHLTLDGGRIETEGGDVRLVATASAGRLEGILGSEDFDVSGFESLGLIQMLDESSVSVSGYHPERFVDSEGNATVRSLDGPDGILTGHGCSSECLVQVVSLPVELLTPDDMRIADSAGILYEENGQALAFRPLRSLSGSISVQADSLQLLDSSLNAVSFGTTPGTIEIGLRGDLEIASENQVGTGLFFRQTRGIFGQARATDVPFTTSNGEAIVVDDTFSLPAEGRFTLGTNAAGTDIRIAAASAKMAGAGIVSVSTFANGVAGDIDIELTDSLTLDQTDPDIPQEILSILSTARGGPDGDGGSITISVPTLVMDGGGVIIARTTGDADAGNIDIHVNDLYVGPHAQIDSGTSGFDVAGGEGNGGNITIRADSQIILEGPNGTGHIATVSRGASAGAAGSVIIQAPRLTIKDGPGISVTSKGSGISGNVILDVGDLKLDRGTILAESLGAAEIGPGDAGNIVIGPGGALFPNTLIRLENGSSISTRSRAASGGSILINARLEEGILDGESSVELVKPNDGLARYIELNDSEISTSVAGGTGSGGNIAIDPSALVLVSSRVVAQADAGAGGNIVVATDFIILSDDSLMDASAGPAGIDGEIVVQGTSVLVVDQSAEQPAAYLRADALMKDRCSARATRKGVGRLIVEGVGDRNAPLDGYLLAWSGSRASSLARDEYAEGCLE